MKLQIRISKDINWIFLLLLILRIIGINEKLFFILSMLYLSGLVLKSKKIYFPKISGLGMYIWFILYATIMGVIFHPIRDVVRDLFYILPTVICIFIGYYLGRNRYGSNKILKLLYIYAGINSTLCIINLILTPIINFENLRRIFGHNVYDIGFIMPIFVSKIFLQKKLLFGKKVNLYLIIIMALQISMSLGRIGMLVPLIILFVLLFLELIGGKNNTRTLKLLLYISAGLIVISVVILYILPTNITEIFLTKLFNSFKEIQQNQEITSTAEAMNNWRAYEIKAAFNQWKNSNILVKILGEGLGKGTKIEYIPYNWKNIVINNQIPLLHNGFYTLLMKGGVFAVFSLLWMFIGNILKCFKIVKKDEKNKSNAIILIAISIGGILNTYVVRGPVQQGAFLSWAILLGCLSYEINKQTYN